MWERAREALLRAVRNPDKALSGALGDSIGQLGQALVEDPRLQVLVNRFARRTFVGVASRYGSEIVRSEEHTSELQSLMRISYAVFCLKKKKKTLPQSWII